MVVVEDITDRGDFDLIIICKQKTEYAEKKKNGCSGESRQ